jgi:hypothetical protein
MPPEDDFHSLVLSKIVQKILGRRCYDHSSSSGFGNRLDPKEMIQEFGWNPLQSLLDCRYVRAPCLPFEPSCLEQRYPPLDKERRGHLALLEWLAQRLSESFHSMCMM